MVPLPSESDAPVQASAARRWAHRLSELCARHEAGDPAARARLWVLISAALDHYVDLHQNRLGSVGREAAEDLVSEKASDLMASIEEGRWRPQDEPAPRVAAFVATTARNGVVDHLRRHGPRSRTPEGEGDEAFDFERLVAGPAADPGVAVAQEEFVEGLVECVSHLPERERRAWRLRVLYEMSTRQIAAHPELQLSPANVDVILYRVRQKVRACMAGKGLDRVVPPPGTFARLWAALGGPGPGEGDPS